MHSFVKYCQQIPVAKIKHVDNLKPYMSAAYEQYELYFTF